MGVLGWFVELFVEFGVVVADDELFWLLADAELDLLGEFSSLLLLLLFRDPV